MSIDDVDAVDKIIILRNHEINGIPIFAKKAEPKGGSGGGGRGGRGGRGGGGGRGNTKFFIYYQFFCCCCHNIELANR